MFAFAVIAIRLLGLWLIADWFASLVAVLVESGFGHGDANSEYLTFSLIAAGVPVLLGLGMAVTARPLARLIVPAEAAGDPAPSISERSFAQVGAVLIGLFVIVRALPRVVAPYLDERFGPPNVGHMVELALGLLLIIGSGLLGGLVGWLRRLS